MANDPFNSFEVPTQMRQLAEQSLEQARKAVDGFMTAAQKTAAAMETHAATAQSGAKDMGQHGPAGDFVQHFRARRFHADALAGGKNNRQAPARLSFAHRSFPLH